MSTTSAQQQSLADARSETHPPMLERGSYIPWESRFKRSLNQKRETQKFHNRSIDNGPYVFKKIRPNLDQPKRDETEDDLMGNNLKQYEADNEAMNLILISIPNYIYNYDSRYFMKQMLLAKKDKAGVILFNEQNVFLIADSSQLKEIEELSANVCMMARIQPTNIDSDEGPSYDFVFIRLKDVTSVRRPSSRGLSSKNSVLSNTKNHSKYGEVHVRTDKKTNVTSKKNVVQTKKIVTNIDVKDTLKAKDEREGMNIPDWMLHEHYHRVKNDEVVKLIFNSRKNKEGEGMNIPDWMLMKEMKHTTHYHMIPISPRTPNPNITEGGSSALRKPTIIRFRVQSQPDPEKPIPTTAAIDIEFKEHLVDQEIRQIVEGNENVDTDEFIDEIVNNQKDLGTRLEPSSDKKSPKVKKSADILIIHDDEEEEESAGDALIRKKGKGIDDIRDTPRPTPIRSPKTHITPISSDKKTLQELTASAQDSPLFLDKEKTHETFIHAKERVCEMAAELKSTMKQVLPLMVDERVNEIVKKTVPLYVAEELLLDKQKTQTDMATMIAEAIQKERETI
nr:hypothetical protein [Tanacetum cinerariifolium]